MSATQDARLPPYEVQRRPLRSDARVCGAGRASAYTAEEILEAIRSSDRCYAEPPISIDWESAPARRMGHPWRAERFEAGEWPTARTARGRFGNFNDAVRKAGLSPRRTPTRIRPNLTGPDAIIEWTRRYGDVPSLADWDPVRARRPGQEWRIPRYHDGNWPSARSVAHHFGSFASAVSAAGLVPRARSSSREQRDAARRRNRLAVATTYSRERQSDVSVLADAVRQVAASRSAGDPVALHAALMDVAAAALACAEVATADGRAAPGVDQNRSN